jgi:hypothetical protein
MQGRFTNAQPVDSFFFQFFREYLFARALKKQSQVYTAVAVDDKFEINVKKNQ